MTPLLIYKYFDNENTGWRAEVPDNWETFLPILAVEINFEDIGFNFDLHDDGENALNNYVFRRRKDAILAAKEILKRHNNMFKICHCKRFI